MVIDHRGEGRKKTKAQEKEIAVRKRIKRAKETNDKLEVLEKVNGALAQKFIEDFPAYVEERKAEFEKELGAFCVKYENELSDPQLAKKIPTLKLSEYLCKSFVKSTIQIDGRKYSPAHLRMASDYYWDCIAGINAEGLTYVPTLQQFARLLNISVATLKNSYLNSQDEAMRETILMIRDRFVDYYTTRGMTREISEVMSIFMLKAEYNIRDNDVPQTVINNNNISINSDMLEKLKAEESQISGGIDLSDEV